MHRGGFEEGLGRDATAVQARAAEGIALDERDVESGRRAVQRCAVATGTATDHHQVELLGRTDHLREACARGAVQETTVAGEGP